MRCCLLALLGQSEEDRKLKDDLEVAVQRLCSAEEADGVKHLALEYLRNEIRTATSSMTSVPKPLKFLRPSYESLKEAFEVRRLLNLPSLSTYNWTQCLTCGLCCL